MWNHDISAAPIDAFIWAATKCGKVTKSHWIAPVGKFAGRWSGLANGELPIAWQHFVVPVHPFEMERSTEGSLETGSAEAKNARKAIPETEDGSVTHAGAGESPATHFMLDDVGGGA